jgi:transcriptional regulator with XRE-family HTH domain
VKPKRTALHIYLREKRIEAELTQKDLGNMLGYKPQFITNWERGASSPPARIMAKLVRVLKIPENEILEILTQESLNYWHEAMHPKKKAAKKRA